ncbi:aspartyl/asparaginyl beta-hydroxylase-like isoform X2 [Pollicipes pollicipes]|uniref:aspartyl/asparaginyl beta-hydroxylase-like isoform X2 n=1 Tax=Pollicipes pollicipes TaxID=41117 RepID=UPI0018857590|nr:aspartyl/asparaginyl beta-hydroxylase-like isoform X2 [Pollicipes pollicipes]
MSGETQARRRKDKKKKRDSVSDDGTGEEDVKEHSEGGSGCLTVIVFLVLLAGVGVLLGLIYVQTQGIRHVEAPAPAAQFAPVVEKVQEAVPPPPADATGDEQPAGQQPQEGAAGSPEEVKQVVYVEAPEPGIQLEGSEPVISEQFVRADAAVEQLQDAPAAGGDPNVVLEERRVRVRQVLRQITDPDGTVREEVVSEEVIEEIEDEAAASDSGTAAAGEAAGSADVTADTPEPAVAAAGVTEPESVTAEAAAPLEGADDLVVEVEDEEVAIPVVEEPVVEQQPADARPGESVESARVPVVDPVQRPEQPARPHDQPKHEQKSTQEKKAKEAAKQHDKEEVAKAAEQPTKKAKDAGTQKKAPTEKPVEKPTEKPARIETPTEKPAKKEKPTEKPVGEKPAKKETTAEEPKKKKKSKKAAKEEASAGKPTDKAAHPGKSAKESSSDKPASADKPARQPTASEEAEVKRVQSGKPAEKPSGGSPKSSESPKKSAEKQDKVKPVEKPKADEGVKARKDSEPAKKQERGKADSGGPKPADKPAKKSSEGSAKPSAHVDRPSKRDTDKHAKKPNKAAPPTAAPEEPEPAEASYDKADITGADDWEVRGELDAADALLQTDAAAGLNAFGAILSRRPRSPRALWGRARALNAQAQQERSNNVLDKAISAFKAVLDLDVEKPLPLALFRQVAETCVQQMRFRGQMDQAARIQQRLIQKFPDDYMLRNHLATVFLTYGQEAAAEEVLQEVLRLWPNNGYAKVHLGFVRRQQGRHEEAALLMQQGLDTNEPGVHDKRFYHNLGDSYHRIGQLEKARETYEEGVRRGLLLSAVQRSLYNVDRLTARPYWTAEQTGSAELISELEAHWETIRAEMLSLLSSDRPEDGFQPEQEQLSKSGDWKQFTLFRRGRRDQYACAKAPKTCALVQRFPEAAGCRRGQVKFSMLAPGTRVWPHTGPTNCRLRCHLGLQVPPGAGITVAGQNRTWEEGKVLIIDDSFEHEVWNDGERTRYILIVDIWHPELTEEERRTLPTI